MTESKTGQDWSQFRAAGLFRDGVHNDTRITARTPDGNEIDMDVVPMHVNGGQDTLFAAPPEEAASMARILPKKQTNCI